MLFTLTIVVVFYIYYKSSKFWSQPILIHPSPISLSPLLPLPGLIICHDGALWNATLTSGGKPYYLLESNLNLTSNGVPLFCRTWNKTDKIVHRQEFVPSPDSNIDLKVDLRPGNAEYYFAVFGSLSYADNNYPNRIHFIHLASPIQINYSVDQRSTIKSTANSLFGLEPLNSPLPIFNIPYIGPPSNVFSNSNATILFSVIGAFGYVESYEYRAISIFSVVTDIATFVLSVIVSVWIFLFGRSKYKTWGNMHVLLDRIPNREINNDNDVCDIIETFLDIDVHKNE